MLVSSAREVLGNAGRNVEVVGPLPRKKRSLVCGVTVRLKDNLLPPPAADISQEPYVMVRL